MKFFTAMLTILSLIFLTSCDKLSLQKPQVFPLELLSFVYSSESYSGDAYNMYNEYFVIANPPENEAALRDVVDSYNKQTISIKEIQKYDYFHRMFYRETDSINRNYTEKYEGHFFHDHIEDHGNDLILTVKWDNKEKDVSYEFESNQQSFYSPKYVVRP